MEARELRYFIAVAEELHFSRAAERLGIAQPPLSRAVSQLERRLGTPLLERSPRHVALTPAGETLLSEGRAALDALAAAERRTVRSGARAVGEPGAVLVSKAGASASLLSQILTRYSSQPDAARVEVELCGPGQQARLLRDGRADVALLHRPFDSVAGFDVETIHTEGQVAVLPASHRLAQRSSLTVAEVENCPDLPMPRWPLPDGAYPEGDGPPMRDHSQIFQLIALGRTCVIVPASVRDEIGPALALVPVTDAPRVTTVIAWPPHSRSPVVAGLVRAALEVAGPRSSTESG